MINVNSVINMNWGRIRELTEAQITALEQTAEWLHTEVVQAQVMPFDTGAMQGDRTFAAGEKRTKTYPDGRKATNEITKVSEGKISLITSSPQVRKLYFHPEYHFQTKENPHAGGGWLKDWAAPPDGNGKKVDDVKEAYKRIYKRITRV